jgi:predicted RNase H-like nuclease (RuvC/YqgF family)
MKTLEARIRDLEALQSVTDQAKELEVGTLKSELEMKIRGEESKNLDLGRKLNDYLSEISNLREKNHNLELEMSKISRIGKREEANFEEEARTWPGIWVSEKLNRYGDYIIAYRDSGGNPLDPRILVDNKDNEHIIEKDVDKLAADASEQGTPIAVLLTREDTQLRQTDKDHRWSNRGGIWILRTTRQWLCRDLDVLKPVVEQMRTAGPDFLRKNAVIAEEVKRTLADLDEIDKELKKAARSIESVKGMVVAYKERLQNLCQSAPFIAS